MKLLVFVLLLVGSILAVQLPDYPFDYQIPKVPTDEGLQDVQAPGPIVEVWSSDDFKLGQVAGIGMDSKGHVHVFHRGSRQWTSDSFNDKNIFQQKNEGPIKEETHIEIDHLTGAVVMKGGANEYFLPHGLSVDSEDNIWLTDVALHQVFKIPAGEDKPSLILGQRFEPGSDSSHFCKPTDVAVASTGEFFVSDGYCNSRIVKFAKDGTYIVSFGKRNEVNVPPFPAGSFNIPHSLALIEDWNMICVADRENERVQCFSAGLKRESRALAVGTFIKKAENLGRVFAIRSFGHFLVGVTNNGDDAPKEVFIVNLENGESETFNANLKNPHALAVASDDTLYVGEIGPDRIVKITL